MIQHIMNETYIDGVDLYNEDNKCIDCGEYKESVSLRICPYEKEIHERIVEVQICDECERERAWNI